MESIKMIPEPFHGPEDPVTPTDLPSVAGENPEAVDPGPEPCDLSPDEKLAGHIRDTIPSLFMWSCMHRAAGSIPERSFRIYRDQLLADSGAPSDPIVQMLVEQLALAHLNLGLLACRSANAAQVQATHVYSSAAARLMAEFRRSALALQAYRAASRQLAATPPKDALMLPDVPDAPDDSLEKKTCANEKGMPPEESEDDRDIVSFPRAASV